MLSVVSASRNDDHGGNLFERMQVFVNGLADQSNRFEMPIELVMVEWNPPPDRAGLADALHWDRADLMQRRIITVPPEIHRTYPHHDGLPLFQMIGKNVGIRRAQAPYILATNIDILLTDELFEYLKTSLKPNAMYRVDRHDVLAELGATTLPTPAEIRAMPVLREHVVDGVRYPQGRPPVTPRQPAARANGRPAIRSFVDGVSNRALAAWDRIVLPKLHTNGCGDFTLTSREVWFAMHGYPEWPAYSWHMDGVVMFQAFAGGVEMIDLKPPMAAIHLEHGEGSGWTPESRRLFERLDAAGVPYLSTAEYRKMARHMVRHRNNFHPVNGSDWGLVSADLTIREPAAGSRRL